MSPRTCDNGGAHRAYRSRLRLGRRLFSVLVSGVLLAGSPIANLPSAWAAAGPVSQTDYGSISPGSNSYRYWDEQVKSSTRVQYVEDPTGQRGIVQRIQVKAGDTNVFGSSSRNERAEVTSAGNLSGFVDGQTVVMSWGVFIDPSFSSPPKGWNIISQIHAAGSGNRPPWNLNISGDQADLQMGLFGGGTWIPKGQPDRSAEQTFSLGPLAKNQWHDFVLDVRFGCAGDGHAALWLDGQPLVDAENVTIGYCGDPGMYWKQGVYRAANDTDMTLWFSDTYRWANRTDAFAHYGWEKE